MWKLTVIPMLDMGINCKISIDYQPSFFQKHRRGKPDADGKHGILIENYDIFCVFVFFRLNNIEKSYILCAIFYIISMSDCSRFLGFAR